MDKTLEENISEILTDIYRVPGMGTQLYSQDIISKKIQDAYILFTSDPDKRWKRYHTFVEYTLDGTTGRTTVPIRDTFNSYDDIQFVYPENSDYPLTNQPFNQNPARVTGDYPRHIISDNVDILKVVPSTATGKIVVLGRVLPLPPFALHDIIPFDYLCIKHFVCWQMILDDGSNPGQAEMHRQLYEGRYRSLYFNQTQEPVSISGRGSRDVPRDWFVQ